MITDPGTLNRRQLLAWLAGMPLALSGLVPACAGRKSPSVSPPTRPPNVAIIGAGLSGLHCAYRLKQAGIHATVYEASRRVGGRVYSTGQEFGEQLAELGGEFIDSGHATMRLLAREFSLPLEDRVALAQGLEQEIFYLSGKRVPDSTIAEQFRAVAPTMRQHMERVESDANSELAQHLDHLTLKAWLDEHAPMAFYPELHQLLEVAYRGEYGRETTEQSSLNLLHLIGWDTPDPFRIFGESDERFHLHRGNESLIAAFSQRLTGQIRRGLGLVSVSGNARGPYSLELVDQEGTKSRVVADRLVIAIPFTKLRQVDVQRLELSALKRRIIEELSYGTNAKLIGAFGERIWQSRFRSNGSVTTTLEVQQSWETSLGQVGTGGLLTCFLGGSAGRNAESGGAEERFQRAIADLESVFPGLRGAYRKGSSVRMHWPSHPHTLGSYTCYAPGQWAFWSLEGKREGNVHFCGEHTSVDFQGYMEGAAETGSRAAGEILVDLRIVPAAVHRVLLALYDGLADATSEGRLCPGKRRRQLSARLASLLTQSIC